MLTVLLSLHNINSYCFYLLIKRLQSAHKAAAGVPVVNAYKAE